MLPASAEDGSTAAAALCSTSADGLPDAASSRCFLLAFILAGGQGYSCILAVLCLHQLRGTGIVDVAGDAPILDALDGLVDDEQRNEKPLLGLHGMAEAVVDGDVQPRGCEQPVEQVLHPGAVDARELVGRDDLDLRQQVGRFVLGIGDARLHPAAGHAHLVDQVAVLRDIGMIGQRAQDVDRAALDIVGLQARRRRTVARSRARPAAARRGRCRTRAGASVAADCSRCRWRR